MINIQVYKYVMILGDITPKWVMMSEVCLDTAPICQSANVSCRSCWKRGLRAWSSKTCTDWALV